MLKTLIKWLIVLLLNVYFYILFDTNMNRNILFKLNSVNLNLKPYFLSLAFLNVLKIKKVNFQLILI